jgi:DNA-nicking Smr family endonuclease
MVLSIGDTNTTRISNVRIPQDLWNPSHNRSANAFHITDPILRYKEVMKSQTRDDVIDLHFQSMKTFPTVLSAFLPEKLRNGEAWVITGSGHGVSSKTHQKGGGVLESAVLDWLISNEYSVSRGKDKNGFGGAFLVRSKV